MTDTKELALLRHYTSKIHTPYNQHIYCINVIALDYKLPGNSVLLLGLGQYILQGILTEAKEPISSKSLITGTSLISLKVFTDGLLMTVIQFWVSALIDINTYTIRILSESLTAATFKRSLRVLTAYVLSITVV